MTLILDPANADDVVSFEGIAELVGITATAEEINSSPLFISAERTIVILLPAAELPGGRTHMNRHLIVAALQYLTAYNILFGGGSLTTQGGQVIQGSGEVSSISETVLGVTRRTDYDVGASVVGGGSISVTHESRAEFFLEEYNKLLALLGLVVVEEAGLASVISTESKL